MKNTYLCVYCTEKGINGKLILPADSVKQALTYVNAMGIAYKVQAIIDINSQIYNSLNI